MSDRDWHSLAAKHGPQRPPLRQGELSPPLPPSPCGRCGKVEKVPTRVVITRTEVLCRDCGAAEWRRQAEAGEPGDPPLYGGRRIEDLLHQAEKLYAGLKAIRRRYPYSQVGRDYTRRYTARDLDRATIAAYRRYWRRKRIWLTQ